MTPEVQEAITNSQRTIKARVAGETGPATNTNTSWRKRPKGAKGGTIYKCDALPAMATENDQKYLRPEGSP